MRGCLPDVLVAHPRIVTAMLGLLEADRVELAWFGRAGRRGLPGGWM
jgi:hypothetical protein